MNANVPQPAQDAHGLAAAQVPQQQQQPAQAAANPAQAAANPAP